MGLFHFSDRGDISRFSPRPPVRHPDAEPLVYAIDEWHSPLYLFPRDCPRIGLWPTDTTSAADREAFSGPGRMRLLIDREFEEALHRETIFRYEFDPAQGFIDCQDHGVWVSRQDVVPTSIEIIFDMQKALRRQGIEVEVVPSLAEAAWEFFDFDKKQFRTTLHVSMIRMSLLPDWEHEVGKPVAPRAR
ncbi:MAG: hypothetical protein JST12_15500 [Armatimonadetes bacterium]|nr:hypothetical protein [Armatimonadota bacterium]